MDQKHRILLVDDEPALCRAFTRSLQGLAVEVVSSGCVVNAAHLLRQDRYEVVISDYLLPHKNGVEFLAEVRRIAPKAKRVLLSGMRDFEVAQRAINQAAVHQLIVKPWIPDSLRSTIDDLVSCPARSIPPRASVSPRAHGEEPLGTHRTTQMLYCLVAALELRDSETQWHSRRVAGFARHLGEILGLKGQELVNLERGALLHDVGKIGVRDAVLLKPGKLSAAEWEEMERHPMLGYQLLRHLEFLGEARLIVLQHQERWDGAGYPAGLRGEEICLGARIFHVVDTYDAITSDRPYRAARDYNTAREELQRNSGIQFDPRLVEAWCEVPSEQWQRIRQDTQDLPLGTGLLPGVTHRAAERSLSGRGYFSQPPVLIREPAILNASDGVVKALR